MPEASDISGALENGDAFDPLAWFGATPGHCRAYAEAARQRGQPVVGILCEFTPREIILAAGGVPVCLCGAGTDTISTADSLFPTNLCPLIKSTLGTLAPGQDSFLQSADLLVAETACDGRMKMVERLAASRPVYLLELPAKADDADAFELWTLEIRKFKEHLERRFHLCITGHGLRQAIDLMNRERALRRRLADLMADERPALTGRQVLGFRSPIAGVEADLQQYSKVLEMFDHGYAAPGSPREREASPARVMVTGVPAFHGAERVVELIEATGAVVVCMENCTGLKPILADVDAEDPNLLLAIARKYFHLPCAVMTPNRRRLEVLRALAAKFRPQCVVELVWQACLTYDVEACRVRQFVEEELQLPYLKITTNSSAPDAAAITAQIEALVEGVPPRTCAAPAC